jgi:hypothetical protein
MSIDRPDFENIEESDLQELVNQASESQRLEFKAAMYEADAREEFLKDISALANTQGGHLVIGMAEVDAMATRIVPLVGDSDGQLRRLEQLARTGIEPRIPELRMTHVPIAAGGYLLVLRCPRSWNPPHRVMPTTRYYMRHSRGVYEPSVQELRTLFTQSASALELARRFRDQRVAVIRDGHSEPKLVGNGRLIFHIVPIGSFSGATSLSVREAHRAARSFMPFGSQEQNPSYNFEGVVIARPLNPEFCSHGHTQVFRDGKFEATISNLKRRPEQQGEAGTRIPGGLFEEHFFGRFHHYIDGLRALGVGAPLVLMITLEEVSGARYVVSNNFLDDGLPPAFTRDVLTLPECVLEDYGTPADYVNAVRPAFDALWNSIGHARAYSIQPDGTWRRWNGRSD